MKNPTKAERKFQLMTRLTALGFTYEEAHALRRIEMTLHRWAEAECGDEQGRCIERDETTGKPFMTYDRGTNGERGRYAIADREAGALKRLAAIVRGRNDRECPPIHKPNDKNGAWIQTGNASEYITPYHQTDPRGCALYLITRAQLGTDAIDSVYNRGLAISA